MFKNIISKRAFSTSRCLLNDSTTPKTTFKKSSGSEFLGNTLETLTIPETPRTHIHPRFIKNFQATGTYDPFDFSMARLHLDKKLEQEESKPNGLDKKFINPLNLYTNPRYLSKYISSTGKILHQDVTKLSRKNQKRVTVAIKRSINAGLLSSVHKDVYYLTHRHGL